MKRAIMFMLLLMGITQLLFSQESTESGSTIIKGKVTDASGNPIEIANVWVGRQMKGTTTDLKGVLPLPTRWKSPTP